MIPEAYIRKIYKDHYWEVASTACGEQREKEEMDAIQEIYDKYYKDIKVKEIWGDF